MKVWEEGGDFRAALAGDKEVRAALPEERIPTHWINLLPDLPGDPLPPLNPGTMQTAGLDDLTPIFPMGIIAQEVSTDTSTGFRRLSSSATTSMPSPTARRATCCRPPSRAWPTSAVVSHVRSAATSHEYRASTSHDSSVLPSSSTIACHQPYQARTTADAIRSVPDEYSTIQDAVGLRRAVIGLGDADLYRQALAELGIEDEAREEVQRALEFGLAVRVVGQRRRVRAVSRGARCPHAHAGGVARRACRAAVRETVASHDLDLRDGRRVQRENALDTLAERHLPHGSLHRRPDTAHRDAPGAG